MVLVQERRLRQHTFADGTGYVIKFPYFQRIRLKPRVKTSSLPTRSEHLQSDPPGLKTFVPITLQVYYLEHRDKYS